MSPMEGGAMPKPSEQAKAAFTKLVPDGPTVTVPGTWRGKPESIKGWIATALELTGRMPPKVPAAKKAGDQKTK